MAQAAQKPTSEASAPVVQAVPTVPAAMETVETSKKKRSFSLISKLGKKAAAASHEAAGKMSQIKSGSAGGALWEAKECLSAPDLRSRRMARLFWGSWAGAIVISVLVFSHFREHFKNATAEKEAQQMAEFFEKQRRQSQLRQSQLNIGTFNIELVAKPGAPLQRGIANFAQVEVVAECDSKSTCEYLEEHITEAKSRMTNVLVAMERETLLSKKGKLILKQNLIDALNKWLHSGTIRNLYFSRLTIT